MSLCAWRNETSELEWSGTTGDMNELVINDDIGSRARKDIWRDLCPHSRPVYDRVGRVSSSLIAKHAQVTCIGD